MSDSSYYLIGFFAVANFGALCSVAVAGFKLSSKFGSLETQVKRNGQDIQTLFSLK